MSAYAVVGPTNLKPRRFNSFAIAVDSGVTAGTSFTVAGRLGRGGGANDHSSVSRSVSDNSRRARALLTDASILARFRTIDASPSRRSTSRSVYRATASGSKPANAARKASRLRRIVIHDSP